MGRKLSYEAKMRQVEREQADQEALRQERRAQPRMTDAERAAVRALRDAYLLEYGRLGDATRQANALMVGACGETGVRVAYLESVAERAYDIADATRTQQAYEQAMGIAA